MHRFVMLLLPVLVTLVPPACEVPPRCSATAGDAATTATAERGDPIEVTPERLREKGLEILRRIASGFEEVRERRPEDLAALAPGVINADELSIHFAIRDASRDFAKERIREPIFFPRTKHSGVFACFQPLFDDKLVEPTDFQAACFFLQIRFSWHWIWPGEYPKQAQDELAALIGEAVRPILAWEAAAAERALKSPDSYPSWLYRESVLELELRRDARDCTPDVETYYVYPQNNIHRAIAVDTMGPCEVFIDGRLSIEHMLNNLMHPITSMFPPSFIRIGPGECKAAGKIKISALRDGPHRLRVLKWYRSTHEYDRSGLAADQPPTWRRVEDAWTGFLLSEELVIDDNDARLDP